MRYREGMEVPADSTYEDRRRLGLAIPGAAIFAGTYLLGVAVYAQAFDPDASLLVPVIGPFIYAARNDSGAKVIWVLDGLAQIGGLAMFAAGMVKRKYVTYWALGEGRHLAVTPSLSPNQVGAMVTIW